MKTVAARTERVPTYCYQCVAGPDLLTVKVEDGVATEVEPNFCAANVHPGGGKVCVKAYGLVQKTYNPNRVLTPMKRSNPKKGRDEDPGFVPISWDEAFDTDRREAERDARRGPDRRQSGYPRVAASFGGGGTPQSYMGTLPGLPRRPGARWTWASARARASSATTPSTCTASSGTAPSSSRPTRRCAIT